MPIDQPAPPAAVVTALQRAVGRRAAGQTFLTPNLGQVVDTDSLDYSTPHRVAFVPLDALQPGNRLYQVAQAGGWRFLIHGSGDAIAAARILESTEQEFHLGEITEGPWVTETEKAIRYAETQGLVDRGSYEAVLLIAPDVHVTALWLQSQGGSADIVIPLAPTSSLLKAGAPNTLDQFMDVLLALAELIRSRSR
jgi:hypothetical protein